MACLSRIRQTRLNYLCSQFKRSYFQVSAPCLSEYIAQNKLPSSSNHLISRGLLGRSNEVFDKVRFFAAPVQFQKKEETKTSKGPRLNGQIKSHMVRLVNDEGGHEIVPLHVAMEQAKRLNHDLVEVDCNAKPIVCKIMDYHQEKYKQQLKEKERSKSKAESSVRKGSCKEVRFSPKIEKKDLQMKADMAKRLMERGYRVKCMVVGSATEQQNSEDPSKKQNLGELIDRLHALIEDVAFVESGPRLEKSQAYIVVRHIKFGPSKKGGKGAAKSADTGREIDSSSQSTGGPSGPIQHPAKDSGSHSTPEQHKMKWSLSDANGAADEKEFDLGNDLENADRMSDQQKKPLPESVPPNVDFFPPRVPNVMGSGANPSENRYSKQQGQGLTRRGPPGAEQYTQQPGNERKQSFNPPPPPPPKQNPTSTSYGIFSNPNASPPRNHGFLGPNEGASPFGFPKTQGPSITEPPANAADSPPTDPSTRRWGLFSGEGSNAKAGRTFQNQAKVER